MKISHFNTFPYGGAATAAIRIHAGLNQLAQASTARNSFNSQFWFCRNEKNIELDRSFQKIEFLPLPTGFLNGALERRKQKNRQREIYRQFNRHLATRPSGVETFSMAELPEPTRLNWATMASDIVHLHWISYLADYPTFFRSIPDAVPLVWTLHDMNAFTGGCHYANQCQQFRFGCGDCEQVTERGMGDVSRTGFEAKRMALAKKTIHVVTPSDWLGTLAQKSRVWPEATTFQTIKYGLDLNQFRPIDKSFARKQLGINSDAVLVGFGADDVNNRRKGVHHLLNAFRKISDQAQAATRSTDSGNSVDTVEGLLFGAGKIEDCADLPRLHQMGFVDSIYQQQLIYSAADMVVVPSREDNQPQVGLEAMACGTPVIGFRAGGIPEYVRHDQTGLLAELGNESQLAAQILQLARDASFRRRLGRQARAMMESEFEMAQQSQKYVQLYQSSIGQSSMRNVA